MRSPWLASFLMPETRSGAKGCTDLQSAAHSIRTLAVDAIVRAGEGHQGVPLGMAEIATALYAGFLKFDPHDPQWWDRDRVVVSNGHGSMLLYALLYLSGYERISLDEIKRFRELGSHCAGHPERDVAAGIEATTGPLGQGVGNALGMAIAEAFLNARFGDALVNHRTWAFVGDGCLQEGVGQEMIALAGHLKLGKLTLLWDDNQITDDGATSLSISEDVAKRFALAGWHVQAVDGHDLGAISRALSACMQDERPSLIAARTVIARGLPRLQGQRGGHSARLFSADADELRAWAGIDWPAFHVPPRVLKQWRSFAKPGVAAHQRWEKSVRALSRKERAEFERIMRGELPLQWDQPLLAYKARVTSLKDPLGGINYSAQIQDLLSDVLPERMVACADLEAPTDHKRRLVAFSADNRHGAYVHCGVREHVMGALANGLLAHGGVQALTVTYLAFSDYMRPAIRMAAMMRLPVKFVFSHDTIGIGKNGPTHQPVEMLASLRAMPNLVVLRPADAVEAVECWQWAMAYRGGPVCLVFSRQVLPAVRNRHQVANLSSRGGYVLQEASRPEQRAVTLLATGSELSIAVQACALLERRGYPTAVVSMPSWELFDQQSKAYQGKTLGLHGVRVAVEAAVAHGWERYLRPGDGFVGMQGFGASGAADDLYRHFGITAKAVVASAMRALGRAQGLSKAGR